MTYTLLLLAGLVAAISAATLGPPSLAPATTMAAAANTTLEDCDDDRDCWTRPDEDCFGIYEPWSRVHCPLRCGFCPGKLAPCIDKLDYCAQFETNTCSLENYKIWARTNCRKHCNLCAAPTRPPGMGGEATTQGQGVTATVPNGGEGTTVAGSSPMMPNSTTAAPAMPDSTTAPAMPDASTSMAPPATPYDVPGTVARGRQDTIIVQGPGSQTPGMCLYHGMEYKQADRWNDGCDYECSCMDAATNRVVCTEKCTTWAMTSQLTGCKLVKEDNECCMRLECS